MEVGFGFHPQQLPMWTEPDYNASHYVASRPFADCIKFQKLGLVGLEPTTKRLRVSCATNCATSPYDIFIILQTKSLAIFIFLHCLKFYCKLFLSFRDRLAAGRQTLDLPTVVRIHLPELFILKIDFY